MKSEVNIDFDRMGQALREHVRKKAVESGSSIVYLQNGSLVEENPKQHTRQILTIKNSKS